MQYKCITCTRIHAAHTHAYTHTRSTHTHTDAAHTMCTPYAHAHITTHTHYTHAHTMCILSMWTSAHYYTRTHAHTHIHTSTQKCGGWQLLLLSEPALGCLCTTKLRHRGLVQANPRASSLRKDYSGLAERGRGTWSSTMTHHKNEICLHSKYQYWLMFQLGGMLPQITRYRFKQLGRLSKV